MHLIRATGLLTVLLAGCTDPCEFRSRCDGDTVEICVGLNDGPSITRTACEGANPRCVVPEGGRAQCVRATEPRCDGGFESHCDGALRVFCNTAGFVEASDCAELGYAGCRVDPAQGGAICE